MYCYHLKCDIVTEAARAAGDQPSEPTTVHAEDAGVGEPDAPPHHGPADSVAQ